MIRVLVPSGREATELLRVKLMHLLLNSRAVHGTHALGDVWVSLDPAFDAGSRDRRAVKNIGAIFDMVVHFDNVLRFFGVSQRVDGVKDRLTAMGDDVACNVGAELDGILDRMNLSREGVLDVLGAADAGERAGERERPCLCLFIRDLELGMRTERGGASTLKDAEHGPFGGTSKLGAPVVTCEADDGTHLVVVQAGLDPERSLSDGMEEDVRGGVGADAVRFIHPVQAGCCKNDGRIF